MANRNIIIIIGIIMLLVVTAVAWFLGNKNKPAGNAAGVVGVAVETAGKYDAFAKCLTDKGIKLYGAYWCGHCKNQKEMFGESLKYVNYIECAKEGGQGQAEVCEQEGISGYPTWQFANGRKEGGEKTLDKLSEISGCAL